MNRLFILFVFGGSVFDLCASNIAEKYATLSSGEEKKRIFLGQEHRANWQAQRNLLASQLPDLGTSLGHKKTVKSRILSGVGEAASETIERAMRSLSPIRQAPPSRPVPHVINSLMQAVVDIGKAPSRPVPVLKVKERVEGAQKLALLAARRKGIYPHQAEMPSNPSVSEADFLAVSLQKQTVSSVITVLDSEEEESVLMHRQLRRTKISRKKEGSDIDVSSSGSSSPSSSVHEMPDGFIDSTHTRKVPSPLNLQDSQDSIEEEC